MTNPLSVHVDFDSTYAGVELSPPPEARPESGPGPAAEEPLELVSLDEYEIRYITRVLDTVFWNKSRAAKILGIERSTLDRKLKRYNVARPERLPFALPIKASVAAAASVQPSVST